VNRFLILLSVLVTTVPAIGQIGGKSSFEFINVPANARLAALGGVNVSLADRDVNFFLSNPSLVGDSLSGMASVNYQFYVADIGYATFSYAHKFKKLGVLTFGVQHMGYGSIQGYDASGLPTGKFNSSETAMIVGKSHTIGNFRLGVNLKMMFSSIAGYRANALAADIGGLFVHPKKPFTIGLTLRNMGVVLSDYSATSDSGLPFDVQVGATFKPQHMPLRFSITGFNLRNGNVTYYNAATGGEKPSGFEKVISHVNAGAEILIHKNVTLMVGYNYFLHQSLKLSNGGGGAGISFGFAASVKSFDFSFSRGMYVAGNAGYTISLSKNIDKLLIRRKAI
jgi:hypothetical protein